MSEAAPIQRTGTAAWLALAGLVILCLGAGWLGTFATTPNIPTWYASLEKPPFNPPNSVFPIVWNILYVLMAVAAWLAWRRRPGVLLPFFVQLALNVAWSFTFFGAQNPPLGLLVIVLLLAAILWTMAVFWPVSRAAALLLLPYLAWVSFATVLNASIWWLN